MPDHLSIIGVALAAVLVVAIELATFAVSPRCTPAIAARSQTLGAVVLISGCRR